MLFSAEVRSQLREHNCRLGLVLQAESESKQLGCNVGGKPEKERLSGGDSGIHSKIHLHAQSLGRFRMY